MDQIDRLEKDKTKADSKVEPDAIQYIETTCEIMFYTLKIHYWSTFHMKIDKANKIIQMNNKKKKFSIDIHQYFVRRSKKYKTAIVLDSITDEVNN